MTCLFANYKELFLFMTYCSTNHNLTTGRLCERFNVQGGSILMYHVVKNF